MDITPLALIGGLVFALTEFARRIVPVNLAGWQTQLASFVIGVAVVFLTSAAALTNGVTVNGIRLDDLDAYSKVVLGLLSTGVFATVPANLLKAIDGTRTTAVSSETA